MGSMRLRRMAILAAALVTGTCGGQTVLYVDVDAPPGGDGSSWQAAFNDLTDAIFAADPEGRGAIVDQLWVAEGVYVPTFQYSLGSPRSAAFYLPRDLEILGGFAGDESSADERDPAAHPTIMDGDIGAPGVASDNCYDILRVFNNVTDTSVLDGFTLRNGHATGGNERGAAAKVEGGDPLFVACRFEENFSAREGGAVYCTGRPVFIDCVFTNNQSDLTLGGAIYCSDRMILIGCDFIANSANSGGGAVFGQDLTLIDCLFQGNTSGGGGGALLGSGWLVEAFGCDFRDNTSDFGDGGALLSGADNVALVECVFIGNSAAGDGGAVDTIDVNDFVTCVSSTFFGNDCGERGGAIADGSEWLRIIGCQFSGNAADQRGGGVWLGNLSLTLVVNSSLAANTAGLDGGGMYINSPAAEVANTILWANTDQGGADESAQIHAAGSVALRYSLVQGLTGALGGPGNIDAAPLFVDLAGPDLVPGTSDDNLRLDARSPCIDAADNDAVPDDYFDLDGDEVVLEPTPVDLEGNSRFVDDPGSADRGQGTPPIVDMGAFEFTDQPPPGPGLYVGPSGGSWFEPEHWAGGEVPDERTDVVIPAQVLIDQSGAVARTVVIQPGGALVLERGSLITTALTIHSAAVLRLDGESSLLETVSMSTSAGGILDWIAGTVRLMGGAWSSAPPIAIGCQGNALLRLEGAATVTAPEIEVCAAGTLRGVGTVASLVTNGGRIEPGLPHGLLAVDGDLLQSGTGVLSVDVDGYTARASYDLMQVSGAVTLGGTLELVVGVPFIPTLGRSIRPLTAASLSGDFAALALPSPLPAGFTFLPQPQGDGYVLLTTLLSTGPRLFVNAASAEGGDGQSWATATNTLAGALSVAQVLAGRVSEIWAATGTYTPDFQSGDRSSTFALASGVSVYGGFAGGEANLEERDAKTNVVVLSGDLLGNDAPGAMFNHPSLNDNSYHVVTASGTDSTAVLDGVTIGAGHADGAAGDDRGGGLLCTGAGATLNTCTVMNNMVGGPGGGVYVANGALALTSCSFQGNRAMGPSQALGHGGGLEVVDSACAVHACSFTGNSAAWGAGLSIDGASDVTISECDFQQNQGGNGGALATQGPVTIDIAGCSFMENVGSSGGAMFHLDSAPVITDCAFLQNDSTGNGGAIAWSGASPDIGDCTFNGNTCVQDGGAIRGFGGGGAISVCAFANNQAGQFGGAIALTANSAPLVADCSFTSNIADDRGGGMYNENSAHPLLVRCQFIGNSTDAEGGAMSNFNAAAPVLYNCAFSSNAAVLGGAVCNRRSSPTHVNCLLENNLATQGGGFWSIGEFGASNPTFHNCTIAANTAFGDGGAIYNQNAGSVSLPVIQNGILWGNVDQGGSDQSAQIHFVGGTTVDIDYSCVQGGAGGLGGIGNIGSDPLLVNPFFGDFRLQGGSPCIDRGLTNVVPADAPDLDGDGNVIEKIPVDLDDLPRFVDDPGAADNPASAAPVVDMGAYEWQVPAPPCPADVVADGLVDVADLVAVVTAWGACPVGPCPADVDEDGQVGTPDLIEVILAWGPCDG